MSEVRAVMRVGSLFAGIGMLELGLEWSGLVGETAWQVEQDAGCRSVLAHWWPDADRSVIDVRAGSAATLAPVDLICGGFPCQDVSSAGLGRGLDGERSGLWREYARIVGELCPEWVVVENVASGAARWLPHVRHDLRARGYRSAAVQLSAADVGAPHRRERIFVVAHRDGWGCASKRLALQGRRDDGAPGDQPDRCRGEDGRRVADTHGEPVREQQQRRPGGRPGSVRDGGEGIARHDGGAVWARHGAQPGLGRGAHGRPNWVDRWPSGRGEPQAAWEPPRSITRERGGNRSARLRAIGNAVVPQCARVVGEMIRDGAIFEVLR